MIRKKLSIIDIARALDISPTTVSFILNGRAKEKRISTALTKKVQQYVKTVGFQPSQLARSFRTGKSNIIGLMVEDIANPFFADLAKRIEEKANQNGYKIFYCSTSNNAKLTGELIDALYARHVDGYIITPSEGSEEKVQFLLNEGAPVILLDRFLKDLDTDYVIVDNEKGTFKAVEHLYKQGFRNIGFVSTRSVQTQMTDRYLGYCHAAEKFDLPMHCCRLNFPSRKSVYVHQITDFLKCHEALDAVVFATNYLALSGLTSMMKLQAELPRRLGIVAFDDHEFFELCKPSITALAQPLSTIANTLMDLLLRRMRDDESLPTKQHIVLPTHLIVRDSSLSL